MQLSVPVGVLSRRRPIRRDHDVLRLHVAMHDAHRVERREARKQVAREALARDRIERAGAKTLAKRRAFGALEDERLAAFDIDHIRLVLTY